MTVLGLFRDRDRYLAVISVPAGQRRSVQLHELSLTGETIAVHELGNFAHVADGSRVIRLAERRWAVMIISSSPINRQQGGGVELVTFRPVRSRTLRR